MKTDTTKHAEIRALAELTALNTFNRMFSIPLTHCLELMTDEYHKALLQFAEAHHD